MRHASIALVVLLAACSPTETADSSTSLAPTTTTTSTTTSSQAAPATSLLLTTTTSSPSTTTTVVSTTSTVSSGTWADEPLITTGFGALGWWDGGIWVPAEEVGALPVVGGESYQIAVVGLEAATTGGPQTFVCEPLGILGVELDNERLLGEFPGPYGVAISAPWELQPYLFEAFSDDGTYAASASELLADRGLVVSDPVIKQLFRTDLEGDGTNEVLVVAEEITGSYLSVEGDYSIAFMQKVVQGEVQTAVLGATAITDPSTQFVEGFAIGAVADLNDDEKMEIVLNSAFWEGFAVSVWEYVNDDIGPRMQLQVGCGS